MKPKEIAIFGRAEAVLHDRAEPALEVSLGTMHRAKGLEFKAVAVVGCDLGLLPLRSVLDGFTDPVERELFVEQERNLLYVALTRAQERVIFTHASWPSALLDTRQARFAIEGRLSAEYHGCLDADHIQDLL